MGPQFKRLRTDLKKEESAFDASPVVFITGLTHDVMEADFHDSLSRYGPIAYVLCLGVKALVEFENLRAAKECVMESKVGTVEVAGYKVNVQFSKSEFIRRSGLESQFANNVLIVYVYNVLYPVTVDVIYQISSIHGRVMRIALVKGVKGVQALVEFDSIASAKSAKLAMNGADIYSGCCTLKVEFSKVEKVNVTYNSHDQWDYTANSPTLPSLSNYNSATNVSYTLQQPINGPTRALHCQSKDINQNYFLISKTLSPTKQVYEDYNFSAQNYNELIKMRKRKLEDIYLPKPTHISSRLPPSSVIMIYHLSLKYFNCDKVFNLVCSFGDCLKIKFINTEREICMVEMRNENDARRVIRYLQGCKIYGKKLELTFSHKECITSPKNSNDYKLPDGTPSFKTFNDSRNWRFINPVVAVKNKIAYPGRSLHFFNAPPSYTEHGISEIFESRDLKPQNVTVLKKSDRSCVGFALFSSISKALEALVVCNHVFIESDCSKNPYVFKLAFAADRD